MVEWFEALTGEDAQKMSIKSIFMCLMPVNRQSFTMTKAVGEFKKKEALNKAE